MEVYIGFITDENNNLGHAVYGSADNVYNALCQYAKETFGIELPAASYFAEQCEFESAELTFYIGIAEDCD